jgi:diguanylate cyclase (GGDEF)-like protein
MSFAAQQCVSTPIGTVLYLALTRNMTSASHRLWWFAGGMVATGGQIASVIAYRRHVRAHGHPERWSPGLLMAFVVGLLWGMTSLVVLPRNEADQSITLAFLACALAGNVVTIGGRRLFASFHIPASVVPFVVFAAQGNSGSTLRALGVLVWLISTVSMHRFVESQQQRAETLETQLVDALAVATQEARHDPLTGLPNRKVIIEAIDEALGSSDRTVLMFIDLDGFKAVNDNSGHHVGDAVLCHLSSRFERLVPPDSVLARLGGDEFAVVLTNSNHADAERLGAAMLKSLSDPISVGAEQVTVGASIGVASSTVGTTCADLMQRADVAMYQAKNNGRNRVEVAIG